MSLNVVFGFLFTFLIMFQLSTVDFLAQPVRNQCFLFFLLAMPNDCPFPLIPALKHLAFLP